MRILAGKFKGRKLLSPPGRVPTRPITGSVKKSLFGMIGDRIGGAVVLDIYCGTGTLGLEALSGGADRCVFAERDRAVLARLRRNIDMLAVAEQCEVWAVDVGRQLRGRLEKLPGRVDLAFIDPPYAQSRQWDWGEVEGRIFLPVRRTLTPDGLVILRTGGKIAPPDMLPELAIWRTRRYGSMSVTIYAPSERAK